MTSIIGEGGGGKGRVVLFQEKNLFPHPPPLMDRPHNVARKNMFDLIFYLFFSHFYEWGRRGWRKGLGAENMAK